MPAPVPQKTCDVCGEFLPHACAPVVRVTRRRFTGRRTVKITDREDALTPLARAVVTSPFPNGRACQFRRVYGIEDYLFIGGDRMSARQAAARLGVTPRTITRYRKVLREAP
jgi:hypothetical protein